MSGLGLRTGSRGLTLLWLAAGLAAGVIVRPPLDTAGAIKRGGYQSEAHWVRTEDGYLLTLFRIPAPGRPPIFLQHGMVGTSREWVALRRPLAFLLADRGYDVWMGNVRANKYGRQHTKYNVSQKEYWDFSWHEMGIYDLPAALKYIIGQTGRNKIPFVGHSMGINMVLVLLSRKPEYNEYISYVIAMAPAVYVAEMRSVLLNFVCTEYAPFMLELFGPQIILPNVEQLDTFVWERCAPGRVLAVFCYVLYNWIGGPTTEMKQSYLPEIFSEFPASTSLKTFAHFGLNVRGQGFRPYTDGVYDLNKVTVPVALFYSDEDYLVHPKNILKLNKTLPRVDFLYKVPTYGFNHLDFMFGENAERLVYKLIFQILNNLKT